MTPETELRDRGVPTTHDQVSEGDYVQVRDGDMVVTGYVELRDGEHACIAEHSGVTYFLNGHDRFVQMLRPRGVLPDGVAVWYRVLSERGAEKWFKAEVTHHFYAGIKPRYNLRYTSPDFEGAYDEAAGVHPEDIELREATPKPDTSINPHLMHEQSTTLREIGELAVRQGANQARAVYDQVIEALSLTEQRATKAGEETGRVKLLREVEQLLTNYDAPKPDHWGVGRGDVMEWLSRALQVGRGHDRERYALAGELTRLGAPPSLAVTQMVEFVIAKTRADARANATKAAEEAASAKIDQLSEGAAETERKVAEVFRLLSYAEPRPSGAGLVERVGEVLEAFRAKIKALEADKTTLLGQVGSATAAPDKIREQSLEAMSLLAQRIPGIQGFTLPQKLREVLAHYDNQITEMALVVASGQPATVIAGADRVRAVIERALSTPGRPDPAGDLMNLIIADRSAVGGWFLRVLANANLAVVFHNWDGIDPTAEPVEPTVKPAGPPTIDDVKQAWGTVMTELGKVPEALRKALDGWDGRP